MTKSIYRTRAWRVGARRGPSAWLPDYHERAAMQNAWTVDSIRRVMQEHEASATLLELLPVGLIADEV